MSDFGNFLLRIQKIWHFLTFFYVLLLAEEKPQLFNGCGGSLELQGDATYGILTSPNYPSEANPNGRYPNDLDCLWYLEGDEATLIQIKIWGLQIELGKDNSNITCDYDYLSIRIESIGAKKFCGIHKPEDIIRGMGKMTVRFVSNEKNNFRGFQTTFQKRDDYNPCVRRSPCVEGTCHFHNENFSTSCECFPGATGKYCDEDVKECLSMPCLNGATCMDDGPINTYECACVKRWKGTNCEIDMGSPCLSNPCKYGGKCEEVNKVDFKCNCSEGYKGHNCYIKTGCGNPGIPYLQVHRRFNFGTILEYSCIEGFNMTGNSSSICLASGLWSSQLPECAEIGAKEDSTINGWPMFMIIIGSLFCLSLFGFATWIIYKRPWSELTNRFDGNEAVETSTRKNSSVYSISASSVSSINDL